MLFFNKIYFSKNETLYKICNSTKLILILKNISFLSLFKTRLSKTRLSTSPDYNTESLTDVFSLIKPNTRKPKTYIQRFTTRKATVSSIFLTHISTQLLLQRSLCSQSLKQHNNILYAPPKKPINTNKHFSLVKLLKSYKFLSVEKLGSTFCRTLFPKGFFL